MGEESKGVAVVTGAASGIGAAIAERFAERGWRVAGLDLRPSGADLTVEVDVSDREAMRAAIERVESELGPVRALVTAAGFYAAAPVGDIGDEDWRRMLQVHLGGVANACWATLPGMLERGEGAIVSISSELALTGGNGEAAYVAAKGAILGFTRSLGAELAPRGIRVNAVAPGPTDTPLLPQDAIERTSAYLSALPLRRLVTPDEVATTVLYLVEEGTYFAGQTISPNAGAVI